MRIEEKQINKTKAMNSRKTKMIKSAVESTITSPTSLFPFPFEYDRKTIVYHKIFNPYSAAERQVKYIFISEEK